MLYDIVHTVNGYHVLKVVPNTRPSDRVKEYLGMFPTLDVAREACRGDIRHWVNGKLMRGVN